ncbi:MAG: hypothetical protein R3E77_03140 [Steroidobacteraceae bacterium]
MTAMKQNSSGPAGQWHAVSVVPHQGSCAAAVLLRHERFLSREAPPLPLAKCSCPGTCPCTYRHFSDRRQGPRRGALITGARDRRSDTAERRNSRGRRKGDQR